VISSRHIGDESCITAPEQLKPPLRFLNLLAKAVLESLLVTYADTEVFYAAIERWRSRAAEEAPDSASQVRRVEAEISGTQSAMERY
jgi:hypothetical protein